MLYYILVYTFYEFLDVVIILIGDHKPHIKHLCVLKCRFDFNREPQTYLIVCIFNTTSQNF